MAIVYGQCHEQIGPFNDTQFMVRLLQKVSINCDHLLTLIRSLIPQCQDRQERDRLIMFIDKLLYNKVPTYWINTIVQSHNRLVYTLEMQRYIDTSRIVLL